MPLIEDRVSVSLKKILLATDFSEASEKASVYAMALAHRFGSTIQIAHVFDPSAVTSQEEAVLGIPAAKRLPTAQERLDSVTNEFAAAGIQAEAVLRQGHRPSIDLLNIAKADRADLIIAGTQSKTGLARLILGSTAESLIRNAPVPVLTIGPQTELSSRGPLVFRKIVYATDFSTESAKASFFALSFAQDSGANLYFCYVLGYQARNAGTKDFLDQGFERALNRMVPQSAYDWCNPECVVEHGDATEAILELAEAKQADLIVLGARTASFWLTHIAHGTSPDILAQAKCPVMTIC